MPWMAAGALLGVIGACSPGGLFLLFLVALTAGLLDRLTDLKHRRFIVTLFLAGFVIRALLSLGLDAGARLAEGQWASKHGAPRDWDLGVVDHTREYVKMGDSDYLSQRGYALVQYAHGVREPVVVYRVQQSYGWSGYAYLVGAFYSLFDFSPYAVKGLNCLIGALGGVLIFFLVEASFNPVIARWSGLLVTFFPSLILWSASNLKEPSLTLCTTLLLLLYVKLWRTRRLQARIAYGALLLGTLALHATLRSPLYSVTLAGAVFLAALLTWRIPGKWRVALMGGTALLIGAALWMHPLNALLERLYRVHVGHVMLPGISYRYLPEEYYALGKTVELASAGGVHPPVFSSVSRAVFHYLVEPLPCRIDNASLLLVYPQMVAWYAVLLLASLGMAWSLRWNTRRSLFLLLMLAAWTSIGALTNGNLGTLVRIRDMVSPLFLVFACAGLWAVFDGRPGRAEKV